MKRFTTRCDIGIGLTVTSGNIVNDYEKVVARLAELEDKLESGQLVELPCKVGDTVYFIYSEKQNAPISFTVQNIHLKIYENDWSLFVYDDNGYGGKFGDHCKDRHIWYIGKDKGVAAARLKELRGKL